MLLYIAVGLDDRVCIYD